MAATVLGAYVLLQTAGVDAFAWTDAAGSGVRYQAGTMGNPDFAGGFLGIALPFVVVVATRTRLLGMAAGFLTVGGLIATRSRGGVAAAAVGLVVLGIMERRRLPRAVRGGAALAVVVVVAAVAARPAPLEQSGFLRTESFEVRLRQWSGAWNLFLERPILGTGPDTFEYGFPRHRSREDGAELGLQIAD